MALVFPFPLSGGVRVCVCVCAVRVLLHTYTQTLSACVRLRSNRTTVRTMRAKLSWSSPPCCGAYLGVMNVHVRCIVGSGMCAIVKRLRSRGVGCCVTCTCGDAHTLNGTSSRVIAWGGCPSAYTHQRGFVCVRAAGLECCL